MDRNYVPESQKRSAVRVDTDRLPVELWVCRLSRCDKQEAALLNVSGAGALLECAAPYPTNLRMHVRFYTDNKMLHSAAADVVRCAPSRQKGRFNLALRLSFALEGKRDILIKWIFEEIIRQRRKQEG